MKNKIDETALTELRLVIPTPRLQLNAPLAAYTTFQIGGPADCLIFPAEVGEVAAVLKIAGRHKIPVTILGNASNVLVLDGGIRGIVVKFDKNMGYLRREGHQVIAGAGALLADICEFTAVHALAGLEFAVGIPGSAGGAVFMNAGAYDGEMSQVTGAVTAVDAGGMRRFEKDELKFSYRHSIFQENGAVICEVEFDLAPGERAAIFRRMDELTGNRRNRQPLESASAGSTFKRPPGHYAGTLIENAGLKGFKVGGAQVSPKHAGFVVNTGGASARDVLALIEEIKTRVYKHSGVSLTPEVRVFGETEDVGGKTFL